MGLAWDGGRDNARYRQRLLPKWPVPPAAYRGPIEPSHIDENGEVRSITWGAYKEQRPAWPIIAEWFARSTPETTGLTLLCGSHAMPCMRHAASSQVVDIETAELFDAYQEALTYAGYADILHRCIIERTPSGGAHLGFLCETIGDDQKITLARRAADKKLLIELLQHQPCTVTPTRIHCKPEHPEGVAYTLVQGTGPSHTRSAQPSGKP